MNDSTQPRWNVRLDAFTEDGFNSLSNLVYHHFRVYESLEKYLGPYNARQRASSFPYKAPNKEALEEAVKSGQMNYFSYSSLINNTIRFCEQSKGMKCLPAPHPTTIHSIQLPQPAFEITEADTGDKIISIAGIKETITVKKLMAPSDFKFIIIRPKLSKLGTPSANNWEVLFFKAPFGYIVDWADSNVNPRWAGTY
jgi:hypothetical protein